MNSLLSMKYAHNIEVRVFSKENEDKNKIKKSLLSLFPFDLEKEKIQLRTENATTHEKRLIKIFSVFIKKNKHTTLFLENLFENLNKD